MNYDVLIFAFDDLKVKYVIWYNIIKYTLHNKFKFNSFLKNQFVK